MLSSVGSVKNLWELNVNSVLLHKFHVFSWVGKGFLEGTYINQIKHMQNETDIPQLIFQILQRGAVFHITCTMCILNCINKALGPSSQATVLCLHRSQTHWIPPFVLPCPFHECRKKVMKILHSKRPERTLIIFSVYKSP